VLALALESPLPGITNPEAEVLATVPPAEIATNVPARQ